MRHLGFSIVEIVVVIAIIGVLAAIAIPSYKDYQIRTKVAKVFSYLEAYKLKELEYYNKKGVFTDAATLGYISGTSYLVPGSYPNISYIVVNAQCSGKRGEIGVSMDPATTGLPGALYFYIALEISSSGVATSNCFTHPNTSYTAVASRAYAPANCQTLQEPSAGNCPP